MRTIITRLLLSGIILILLAACHSKNSRNNNNINIGAMAGPEAQLVRAAAQVAQQKYELKVKVVTFSDYSLPNRALSDGNIDANMFQHKPFLDTDVKAHQYKLAIVGKTFIYPIGVYSKKIKSLKQLSDGDKVAIPNDASNEARSLLLLQQAGVIKLRFGISVTATPQDIASNPKQLKFEELDAADLPRALPDVSAAVITNTFAIQAGLKLSQAIYEEGPNSPYANLLVVRAGDQNQEKYKQLLQALRSPQVVAKAKALFGDGAILASVRQS